MGSGSGGRWGEPACLVPFPDGQARQAEAEPHIAEGGAGGAYVSSNVLAKVGILDPAERKKIIAEQAEKICADAGVMLRKDDGLMDEVVGLVDGCFQGARCRSLAFAFGVGEGIGGCALSITAAGALGAGISVCPTGP